MESAMCGIRITCQNGTKSFERCVLLVSWLRRYLLWGEGGTHDAPGRLDKFS